MQPEDIIMTLKEMKVLDAGQKVDAGLIVNKNNIRQWLEANKASAREPVDSTCFVEREDDEVDEEDDMDDE